MRIIFATVLLTSFALSAEQVVHRHVPYTEPKNEEHTVDIFVPARGEDHPVLIWIDGGRERDDQARVKFKPESVVNEGFIFVSINDRLQSEAMTRQGARRAATVIRWTRDHAKEYGGDPGAMFVGGNSVGAQLAALVCTDESYLKAEDLSLSIIKGCVPVNGDAFDVPLRIASETAESAEALAKKFGSPRDQKELSPVTHIAKDKDIPPFLMLQFPTNPIAEAQAKRMQEVLVETGVKSKVITGDGNSQGTFTSETGLPLYPPACTYSLFGFLESIIKPRHFATFQAKLDKNVTPTTAEAAFGTPNALGGSGVMSFEYDLADGTSVTLIFLGRRGRFPLSGTLFSAAHTKKDGTVEVFQLK